ncbi:MAG TPA: preprotein translocase subunit SecG [Ginsengibacter sp.]|nr:preprotein translocase subunit SecG [Ginsengibacter sp.]HRP17548.1 preprotein translocase subunit SecG [Ginsengibacter sp.]HRP44564.1 preprotein translocase subunit SecG [Ginsengibacter sp.]
MLWLFGVLIILSSIILGIIVLIQNPKGGGLTANLGGFGNQLMGVKRTTDILEKGTWLFAGIIGVLCILSSVFISGAGGAGKHDKLIQEAPVGAPLAPQTQQMPEMPSSQQTVPLNSTPAPAPQQ